MKTKSLLSSICFIFITTFLVAQAPETYQMNKNAAIQFDNNSNDVDGTEIIRQGGNSLQIRYLGSPLRFWALDNKPFQLRNSLNEINIQLNPNGGKSYLLGKLAINVDTLINGYKLQVAGNIRTDETHTSKIKFFNNTGILDGTEINKTGNNQLRLKYFGNNLVFDALDDNPMQLRNAANETMVQFAPDGSSYFLGGNVGIGTTSPSEVLTVNGNIRAVDAGANLILYRFLRAPDGAGNNLHVDASAGNDLYFNHYHGENIRFGFNGEKMVVTSAGDVGINAISPSAKLEVNGPDNDGSTGTLKISTGTQTMILDANEIDGPADEQLQLNQNVDQDVGIAGGGGGVSIGISTIPTGYKLAVDGKIISEELKVKNSDNWPDYVFHPDYPLMSLEKLEASILLKGHLPGIPSAEDVEANGGVEVGDMQQRLLEKVEELTLHIIQLEKRIKELEQAGED